MDAKQFENYLVQHDACVPAYIWAKGKSLAEVWEQCELGDWMLWLLQVADCEIRLLTAYKAACAEFARPYMKDARSIAALEAAHAFGRGEISSGDLSGSAADSAAAAAAADAAASAAARFQILKKCANAIRAVVSTDKIHEIISNNG